MKIKGLGAIAEQIAVDYLAKEGFKILDRNVRFKQGEIDIVASRKKELHFVEVRSKTMPSAVSPIETITEKKQQRIKRAAQIYLIKNFKDIKLPPCYLSVIGISFKDDKVKVEAIYDAFE